MDILYQRQKSKTRQILVPLKMTMRTCEAANKKREQHVVRAGEGCITTMCLPDRPVLVLFLQIFFFALREAFDGRAVRGPVWSLAKGSPLEVPGLDSRALEPWAPGSAQVGRESVQQELELFLFGSSRP